MTAATADQLQELYIAYFGRPADPSGLAYWLSTGISTKAFAAAMYAQPEFQTAFPPSTPIEDQVNALYLNLFGRTADAAGLLYWTQQIGDGLINIAELGAYLTVAASPADRAVLDNKLAAANLWTADVAEDPLSILAYTPTSTDPWIAGPGLVAGQSFLSGVTDTPATPDQVQAAVEAMTVRPPIGLTPEKDTIVITTASTVDTIEGVVTGPGAFGYPFTGATWTPLDSVQGNGLTQVNLLLSSPDGAAAFGTLTDIAAVNLTSGVDGGFEFQASTWNGIGAVNLVGGASYSDVYIADLESTTDLSVSGVDGNLDVDFRNNTAVYIEAGRNDAISYADGAFVGAAAVDGYLDAEFYNFSPNAATISLDVAGASGSVTDFTAESYNADLTIEGISATGSDFFDGFVGAGQLLTIPSIEISSALESNFYIDGDGTADIAIEDLSIEAGADGIALDTYNAASIAVDTASLDAVDGGAAEWNLFDIADVTVGTATVAGEDGGSANFYNFDSLVADEIAVSGFYAYAEVGDFYGGTADVGVVDLAAGIGDASFYAYNGTTLTVDSVNAVSDDFAQVDFYYVDDIAVADVAIAAVDGELTVVGATDADFGAVSILASSDADVIANDDVDNLTIDSVELLAGDSFNLDSQANTGGTTSIGDVLAIASSAASFGDIYVDTRAGDQSTGDVTASAGTGGLDIGFYQYSEGTAVADQSVTVGDILASTTGNLDISVFSEFYSYGGVSTVGTTTLGDTTATFGANANFYAGVRGFQDDSAAIDDITVGSVSVGDVSLATITDDADANVNNLFYSTSYYSPAADTVATLENISVGDVSIAGADSFYASVDNRFNAYVENFYQNADIAGVNSAGLITIEAGDSFVGNIDNNFYSSGSISGTASFAGFDVAVGDDVGALNAFEFYADESFYAANGSIDDVSFGDIGLSTGSDFYSAINLSVDQDEDVTAAFGSVGAVSLGDVTLATEGNNSFSDTDFNVYADGDIAGIAVGQVDLTILGDNNDTSFYGFSESTDTANTGFSIGDSSIAGIALDVEGESSSATFYQEFDGNSIALSDFGDLAVGDVSVISDGLNADGYAYLGAYDWVNTIGDYTIGSTDLSANGEDSYAGFYVQKDGSGGFTDSGDTTFGDLSLTVKGQDAEANFEYWATNVLNNGATTFGDITIAVGNDDYRDGATADVVIVSAGTNNGILSVGDVSLTGTTTRTALIPLDTFQLYDASVYLYNNTDDISIGDVTVSGGDGVSDNFQDFSVRNNGGTWFWANTGGDITIGDVDYSGYATTVADGTYAVKIDVSGTSGAANITGSGQDDTISDNEDVNIITLGDGQDVFRVNPNNTVSPTNSNTSFTGDTITDFATADDLVFIVGGNATLEIDKQGGNTPVTYNQFVSDAVGFFDGDANTDVWIGLTSFGALAAVDIDGDDAIDYILAFSNINSTNFVFGIGTGDFTTT